MLCLTRPFGGPTPLAAQVTLLIVLALFLLDDLFVRRVGGRQSQSRHGPDRGTFWWIQMWQVVALGAALVAPSVAPFANLPAGLWPVGAAIALAGIAVRLWSVSTLGHHFQRVVSVDADQELVVGGPYKWVRHPAYSGVLIAFAGIAVAQSNVVSIVAAVTFVLIGYVPRIRVEEQAMESRLGDRYRVYAEGRARLVPHLW